MKGRMDKRGREKEKQIKGENEGIKETRIKGETMKGGEK